MLNDNIYQEIVLQQFCKYFDGVHFIYFITQNFSPSTWYELLYQRVHCQDDDEWCKKIGLIPINK